MNPSGLHNAFKTNLAAFSMKNPVDVVKLYNGNFLPCKVIKQHMTWL